MRIGAVAARAEPPLTPPLETYFERVLNREHWTVLADPALVVHVDSTEIDAIDRTYDALRNHACERRET